MFTSESVPDGILNMKSSILMYNVYTVYNILRQVISDLDLVVPAILIFSSGSVPGGILI